MTFFPPIFSLYFSFSSWKYRATLCDKVCHFKLSQLGCFLSCNNLNADKM